MKKTRYGKLNHRYNMQFPLFLLYLSIPLLWVPIIAGDFLIGSCVILLMAHKIAKNQAKAVWKSSIAPVLAFGFLGDMAGALSATLLWNIPSGLIPTDWTHKGGWLSAYEYPGLLPYALLAIIVCGMLTYVLTSKYAFNHTDLSAKDKKRMALYLAVFMAPYFILIPTTVLGI